MEEIATDYAGKAKVVKVNTDENQEVARTYGIMSIPTIAVFNGGKVVAGVVGAAPKHMLKELLDKHSTVRPVK